MIQLLLFGTPFLLVMFFYIRRQRDIDQRNRLRLEEAVTAGLTEPPSLHPIIDPATCIGCGACVPVCPEHALGLVDAKAVLIDPTHCIGHGACAIACPVKGIRLVFGTEQRGMDIPQVSPEFETNVPGIFIAGELGGMGLIRKTTMQGIQAIEVMVKRKRGKARHDVIIIGAGPAGIAATLAAKDHKLNYVTVEQEEALGGTVYHYPRNKLTMTAPVKLPIVGTIKMFEIRKEELLGIWNRVVKDADIKINFFERMEKIAPSENGFTVQTNKATYETTHVLLCIGRRGTPRKLDVPGENQAKVVYRLIDAEQYRGLQVLVVGGGDSALEAAISMLVCSSCAYSSSMCSCCSCAYSSSIWWCCSGAYSSSIWPCCLCGLRGGFWSGLAVSWLWLVWGWPSFVPGLGCGRLYRCPLRSFQVGDLFCSMACLYEVMCPSP